MDFTYSYQQVVPRYLLTRYEFHEVRNAAAILASTNPTQFEEILAVLSDFYLYESDLIVPGGQESQLAARLNGAFRSRQWREARVDTEVLLKLVIKPWKNEVAPTLEPKPVVNEGFYVDNFLGRVALDVEWNAKDGNLDRDLAAYRALYEFSLIDAAVIITRTQGSLRVLGRRLGVKAGRSQKDAKKILGTTTTTNTDKLLPRLSRGDSGGCPLLVVAISANTYAGDDVKVPKDTLLVDTDDTPELPVVEE